MIKNSSSSASQWNTVGSSSPLSFPFVIRWPRTSRSTRRSPADCASARSTSPERSRARRREPLDSRVLLYDGEELVGAKQNRILNVSVLVEAKSTLRIPVSRVEQGAGRGGRRSSGPAGTSRMPSFGGAKPRRRPRSHSRRAFHRARSGTRCMRERWTSASPHQPARAQTSIAHARAICAHSRTRSPRNLASAARSSGSGATCASTRSRGPMPSRASGRSSGRATCWTRSTGSVGSRRRSPRSTPSSQTSTTRWCRGSRRSGSARTSACAATG